MWNLEFSDIETGWRGAVVLSRQTQEAWWRELQRNSLQTGSGHFNCQERSKCNKQRSAEGRGQWEDRQSWGFQKAHTEKAAVGEKEQIVLPAPYKDKCFACKHDIVLQAFIFDQYLLFSLQTPMIESKAIECLHFRSFNQDSLENPCSCNPEKPVLLSNEKHSSRCPSPLYTTLLNGRNFHSCRMDCNVHSRISFPSK